MSTQCQFPRSFKVFEYFKILQDYRIIITITIIVNTATLGLSSIENLWQIKTDAVI